MIQIEPLVPAEIVQPKLVKLARSSMRAYAVKLHREQNGICPLCGQKIDLSIKGEGVIDHDHDTGRIRGLLHRSCNAAEGKISNATARWGAKSSSYTVIIQYLRNLIAYLERPPKNVIYTMHKSADDKRNDRNRRAREARAAAKAKRVLALKNKQENM